MMQSMTVAVTAAGRAGFSLKESATVRAQLQRDLATDGRTNNLKHADDQSIAALMAMRAARCSGNPGFGILAAPRVPGLPAMVTTVERFQSGGAWSVSPHIIPHCSLHSTAGLLSVTFGIIGPNLGVGGTANREGEAWLVAAGWLGAGMVPGVWIVMTGLDGKTCRAVAVCLHKGADSQQELVIVPPRSGSAGLAPAFTLEAFDHVLSLKNDVPVRARWVLQCGAGIVWRNRMAAARAAA